MKFLLFILIAHALVFLVSKITLTFISVGMLFPVILLIIYLLTKLPKKLAILILLLIFSHNIYKTITSGYSLFKVQPGMNLKDELAIVNKTYDLASGREFSIDTTTIPYQYPTLWAYLYKINGRSMPYYRGITAYSFAGKDALIFSDATRAANFTIIEPRAMGNDSDEFKLNFFVPGALDEN